MLKSILQDDQVFYYVAYARVSTKQQEDGISLDSQMDEIHKYVARMPGTWEL